MTAGSTKSCVIFDMDGTLADTLPLTTLAFEALIPQFGLPMPEPGIMRRAVGFAVPEFYRRIFPNCETARVDAFGEAVEKLELELTPSCKNSFLFDGVRELLEELRRRGIRIAVASTGSAEHVYSVLGHEGVTAWFDPLFCGEPDKTAMLRRILGGDDPSRFLMVGDMEKDSASARNVGITSVGARFGYLGGERRGFDLFIDRPCELLTIASDF